MPGPAGRRDASEGLGDAEGGHGSAFCSALPPGGWDLPAHGALLGSPPSPSPSSLGIWSEHRFPYGAREQRSVYC